MSAFEVGLFIAVSVSLNSLIAIFTGLKSSYLLMNVLHLTATGTSAFTLVAGIPAYIRPFMGSGVDLFPLFGFHRRSYYCLSWLLYSAGQLALALMPTHEYHYLQVVLLTIVYGFGANLLFVLMDSIMVAVGNRTGTISNLQSVQQGLPMVFGLVLSSWLPGWVVTHWSYQHCFLAGGALALLGAATTLLIHEKPVDRRYEHLPNTLNERHTEKAQDKRDTSEHAATLGKALASPGLWICLVYFFYLVLTPGTGQAQLYYSVKVLHFKPEDVSFLQLPGNAAAIAGTVLFLLFGKRLSTKTIVWGAFLGDLFSYPMWFFYHDHTSAFVVTLVTSFVGMLYTLCLLTFASKVCPKGVEASIYALFAASLSLAGNLSNQIGSWLYDFFGPLHHHSIQHGWNTALIICIVLTAVAGLIIPFLPRWALDPKYEHEQPSY
jgi:MFS family permease